MASVPCEQASSTLRFSVDLLTL